MSNDIQQGTAMKRAIATMLGVVFLGAIVYLACCIWVMPTEEQFSLQANVQEVTVKVGETGVITATFKNRSCLSKTARYAAGLIDFFVEEQGATTEPVSTTEAKRTVLWGWQTRTATFPYTFQKAGRYDGIILSNVCINGQDFTYRAHVRITVVD